MRMRPCVIRHFQSIQRTIKRRYSARTADAIDTVNIIQCIRRSIASVSLLGCVCRWRFVDDQIAHVAGSVTISTLYSGGWRRRRGLGSGDDTIRQDRKV